MGQIYEFSAIFFFKYGCLPRFLLEPLKLQSNKSLYFDKGLKTSQKKINKSEIIRKYIKMIFNGVFNGLSVSG
jgi:hypothetical protein